MHFDPYSVLHFKNMLYDFIQIFLVIKDLLYIKWDPLVLKFALNLDQFGAKLSEENKNKEEVQFCTNIMHMTTGTVLYTDSTVLPLWYLSLDVGSSGKIFW